MNICQKNPQKGQVVPNQFKSNKLPSDYGW